jgi:hypothetical protein
LRVAPSWFELLAWVALGLGFASALAIAADIVVLGNRQHMAIMDVAFPLTALYLGPIALWAYFARGRRMSRKRMHMNGAQMNEGARDSWWQVSLSDSHCGAGCALGDIAGEWIVWATGLTTSSSHWFLMQIGMILGFATSWPVNRWLLRHGIKEPMATV